MCRIAKSCVLTVCDAALRHDKHNARDRCSADGRANDAKLSQRPDAVHDNSIKRLIAWTKNCRRATTPQIERSERLQTTGWNAAAAHGGITTLRAGERR
jgi:hypothetical protein